MTPNSIGWSLFRTASQYLAMTWCVMQKQQKPPSRSFWSAHTDLPLYADCDFVNNHLPKEKNYTKVRLSDIFHTERLTTDYALSRQAKRYLNYAPYALAASAVIAIGVFLVPNLILNGPSSAAKQRAEKSWYEQALWEKDSIIGSYNRAAATYPIDNWVSSLLKILNQIPLEAGGWYFTEFNCKTGMRHCDLTWANSGFGTFKSLDYTVNGLGALTLVNPDEAKQKIEMLQYNSPMFSEPDVKERILHLPDVEQFKIEHVSVLQLLRTIPELEFSIQAPTPGQRVSNSPSGVQQSINFPGFDTGVWELQGKGINILIDSVLKLDPNVYFGQLLKINITYNERVISADWKIGGEYVSKT